MSDAKRVIGSGRNITRSRERVFKRGQLMFVEGEMSKEMFIIRSGRVRILKQEGENLIELAVLGRGSVLGELSLLDDQPRSATGQVIEDVNATVIDKQAFEGAMKAIPSWLANIINLVVKRLRDTMKRTSDSIVKRSVSGVTKLILLKHATSAEDIQGGKGIRFDTLAVSVSETMGVGGMELHKILIQLSVKSLVYMERFNDTDYVVVPDTERLELYMNYLRMHQQSRKVPGEDLSEEGLSLINSILAAGKRNGREVKPGIMKVAPQQVEIEIQREEKGVHIHPEHLDELTEAKLVIEAGDRNKKGAGGIGPLFFSPVALRSALRLRENIENFREEVLF